MQRSLRSLFGLALVLTLPAVANESYVGVGILPAVAWSPGDSVRDGAGEFEVLLRVAQLQRTHRSAGLVSIGNRHGLRPAGGERALWRATLTGVPVVKLAPHREVAPAPDGLFLDGGKLSADQASRILADCLLRHGAPPTARDADQPAASEVAAIRAHLLPFQAELTLAARQRVASL